MKKMILIFLISIIALCSCTANQNSEKSEATPNGKTINYICPMRKNYIVEYSVDGETARLYTESNKIYELEKALSVIIPYLLQFPEIYGITQNSGTRAQYLEDVAWELSRVSGLTAAF